MELHIRQILLKSQILKISIYKLQPYLKLRCSWIGLDEAMGAMRVHCLAISLILFVDAALALVPSTAG